MGDLLWIFGAFIFYAQTCLQVATLGAGPQAVSSNVSAANVFQCDEEGVFPDPKDCRSYYRCTITLQAKHESCLWWSYFHPVRKGCSIGGCSILTKPSRFGLSAANSTKASDEEFQCSSSGLFPDPEDCRAYYSCDSNLRPRRYLCYFGVGHYDIDNNYCTLGFC